LFFLGRDRTIKVFFGHDHKIGKSGTGLLQSTQRHTFSSGTESIHNSNSRMHDLLHHFISHTEEEAWTHYYSVAYSSP
jgi:hypothetical protein